MTKLNDEQITNLSEYLTTRLSDQNIHTIVFNEIYKFLSNDEEDFASVYMNKFKLTPEDLLDRNFINEVQTFQ